MIHYLICSAFFWQADHLDHLDMKGLLEIKDMLDIKDHRVKWAFRDHLALRDLQDHRVSQVEMVLLYLKNGIGFGK